MTIVVLQWLAWFGVPLIASELVATYVGALGRLLGGLAIVVWWAFFSRAPRFERWGAVALMFAAVAGTRPLLHVSVRTSGMGITFLTYALPVLSLAFVFWAVAARNLRGVARWASMIATIVLACIPWTLFRTDGITGAGAAEFAWRWSPTAEERLLAGGEKPVSPPVLEAAAVEAQWTGFRGDGRDGVVHDLRIESDWTASPPVKLWSRPIGPGMSSFAVGGGLLYTHEQRGGDEVVVCHDVTTGAPVWRHRDPVRFWDPHAGAGPRATPALAGDRVYTLGATGILNALDARLGTLIWSRDTAGDTGAALPEFGFTGSPLVVDDLVVVYTDRLAAYDLKTGKLRWASPAGVLSFSSPHWVNIDGIDQILQVSGSGVTSVALRDGDRLWEHKWPGNSRIVQPALIAGDDVLIGSGAGIGIGMRRIAVAHGPAGWTAAERWTSTGLKPYFNDFAVHEGHAYGFDGSILACIDLEDGQRRWKGGRYGHGQLILLAAQDLLLVVSESGELALVRALPNRFTELARFEAIQGKTWNHPALAGDLLLIRNREEMAAFRLTRPRD